MTHLAEGFVSSGYDMKWVHREILNPTLPTILARERHQRA